MTTQELRLGNYVLHNGNKCIITAIDYDEVQVDEQGIYMRLPIEDIEPIPLTKKLMTQLGFEEDRIVGFVYSKDSLIHVNLAKPDKSYKNIHSGWASVTLFIHCKYLHELQNAFYAITGEELEVKFE